MTGFLPANKGDRYLPIKRELAGKPRRGIYQNREDNKGNKAERKKEEKGNFSNHSERKSCSILLPYHLFQAREENRKTGEEATLPAEISHTLVFLPGTSALPVLPLLE